MRKITLRLNEKNYELLRRLSVEKNISRNEYLTQLIEKDATDHLWEDVEQRMNRKIELLSEVMEQQTKEYINNRMMLQAMMEIMQEVLNVEVIEDGN